MLRSVTALSLQIAEGILDLVLRGLRDRTEWQSWRPAVIPVYIHCMFQTRHSVKIGHQNRGMGDALLPVDAGFVFPRAVRLPDRDGCVRRRARERKYRAVRPRLERFPYLRFSPGQHRKVLRRRR